VSRQAAEYLLVTLMRLVLAATVSPLLGYM
jgi:hypothetical protein